MSALWPHQQRALDFLAVRPRAFLVIGMGGGKTRIIAEHVRRDPSLKLVLVLCPAGAVPVWPHQMARWAPEVRTVTLGSGSTLIERAQRLREAVAEDGRLLTVANLEVLDDARFFATLRYVEWDLIVWDEIHRCKAPGGRRSRRSHTLARTVPRVIGMTGTWMPHSPLDLYSQYRIIDEGVFGTQLDVYRRRYAVSHARVPQAVLGWRMLPELDDGSPNPDHSESVAGEWARRALSRALVVSREETERGLPPLVSTFRTHPLPAAVRLLYDELYAQWAVDLREWLDGRELAGVPEDGEILPQNVLVRLLRLAQLASGHLPTDNGGAVVHSARRDELVEVLSDLAGELAVVFCRFAHELAYAQHAAEKLGVVYGELSARRRDALDGPELADGVQVAGVQLQAGGVGIDLSGASVAVYIGHTYSLGDYEQSLKRLHRPGQEAATVRAVHVLADDTVEQGVYNALEQRRSVVQALTESLMRKAGQTDGS